MDTPNLALLVLLDSKIEYSNQIKRILIPRLIEGIQSVYQSTSSVAVNNPEVILISFQKSLSNIPNWTHDVLEKEYLRIIKTSECDWLDKLIEAIFICYTKILSVVQVNNLNNMPIQLAVPNSRYFIHQCYIDLARSLWHNPYPVYQKGLTSYELYQNQRQLEAITGDSIIRTIRRLIPTKHLLNQFLKHKDDNGEGIEKLVDVAKNHLTYPPLNTNPKEFTSAEKNIVISNTIPEISKNNTQNELKEDNSSNLKPDTSTNIKEISSTGKTLDGMSHNIGNANVNNLSEINKSNNSSGIHQSSHTQSIIKGGANPTLSPEIQVCTIKSDDTSLDINKENKENMIFHQLNTLEDKKSYFNS